MAEHKVRFPKEGDTWSPYCTVCGAEEGNPYSAESCPGPPTPEVIPDWQEIARLRERIQRRRQENRGLRERVRELEELARDVSQLDFKCQHHNEQCTIHGCEEDEDIAALRDRAEDILSRGEVSDVPS